MKILKTIEEGQCIPWGYRFYEYDFQQGLKLFAPLGIHWLMILYRKIGWEWFRERPYSWKAYTKGLLDASKNISEGLDAAEKRGYERGQADLKKQMGEWFAKYQRGEI